MPIELVHVFLGLMFLAVWVIAGAILIRQR